MFSLINVEMRVTNGGIAGEAAVQVLRVHIVLAPVPQAGSLGFGI